MFVCVRKSKRQEPVCVCMYVSVCRCLVLKRRLWPLKSKCCTSATLGAYIWILTKKCMCASVHCVCVHQSVCAYTEIEPRIIYFQIVCSPAVTLSHVSTVCVLSQLSCHDVQCLVHLSSFTHCTAWQILELLRNDFQRLLLSSSLWNVAEEMPNGRVRKGKKKKKHQAISCLCASDGAPNW